MARPLIDLGPTVSEAAASLNVHPEHIRRLIRTRRLVARKIGKRYHIDADSLRSYALGQGDGRHRHLAARWASLVVDRRREPELRQLLADTFALSHRETEELVGVWRQHGREETL